ncbi:hypothetical protein MLD38_006412 [Melastoma candidum]|uniref:Uncharacterized protein n=1 Tax=Melastoma candidum TaxID=119954 RepID=A0ACB9RRZ4_9MYRT|nr:hypothetical protein MLD38_006412 [Melastoma candidum]
MLSFSSSQLLVALLLIIYVGSILVSSHSREVTGRQDYIGASLLPSSHPEKATGRKSTLPVIHRDGHSHPRSSSEQSRDIVQIIRLDNERVAFIQSKFRGVDQTLSSGKVRLGAILGAGNYVVNISLGTPKRGLTVAFDTGSALTWTQCLPCVVSCYRQVNLIFDPSRSSSYRNVSCASTTCAQIASGTSVPPSCSGSTCLYGIIYGDSSYSNGFFATEKLTLSPTDKINNFQFGCGQDNQGLFGSLDGLMGLSRDRISIVEQTASKYGRIFSYCLPDTSTPTGYLSLGAGGRSSAAFTPMLTLSEPSFYGVKLVAINIEGKRLPISPTVFSRAGTIIDSGTVITRLPRTAYRALRTAFRQAMRRYLRARPPPGLILDTCYNLRRSINPHIPSVTFTFGGDVNINLTRNNLLYTISRSCECLAFTGNSDDSSMGIYGNVQQLKFEVTFNLPRRQIGFVPNSC